MSAQKQIVIISASTRNDRQSHKVSLALQSFISDAKMAKATILDLADYPLVPYIHAYHKDRDNQNGLQAIKQILDAATGIIFVSPEYNGSYTGALKNTLDHFPGSVYHRKPIGVVSVSSGGLGGMRAALQMQQLVLALFGIPSPTMLLTPNVKELFSEDGQIRDLTFVKKIETFLKDYFWLHQRLTV